MLKHIVMHIRGLIMGQYTRRLALQATQLWHNVRHLLVSFILGFQSAVSLWFRVAQTMLNIKAWPVNLTILVRSIKAVLINVVHRALLLGQQLLTIARQTLQRAPQATSRKRGRPVGSTKSAQLRSQKNTFAQIPTDLQSTQAGVKPQGRVGLPHQRAKAASKKGK